MVIYGIGYIAVFGVFALLYWHAYRSRARLELNELEQYDTLTSMKYNLLLVGIGVLSIAIAFIGGADWAFWSGMTYVLTAPLIFVLEWHSGTGRRKLEDKVGTDSPLS